MENTPLPFQSLIALISAVLLRMQYCFWFNILAKTVIVGHGCWSKWWLFYSYRSFYLVFPVLLAFTPLTREPIWMFCKILLISISFKYSRAKEILQGGWETHGLTGYHFTFTNLHSNQRMWWDLGSPGVSDSLE